MSGGNWKELFQAACEGDLALLAYHAENGVDVNFAHPEFLSTPLVACILAGQEPAARLLLAHGADPDLGSEFDAMTPWQAAEQMGYVSLAQELLRLGAKPVPPPRATVAPSSWSWRRWWRQRSV
jgi:ankyrin repeat protein